jgi:hypothetical protein
MQGSLARCRQQLARPAPLQASASALLHNEQQKAAQASMICTLDPIDRSSLRLFFCCCRPRRRVLTRCSERSRRSSGSRCCARCGRSMRGRRGKVPPTWRCFGQRGAQHVSFSCILARSQHIAAKKEEMHGSVMACLRSCGGQCCLAPQLPASLLWERNVAVPAPLLMPTGEQAQHQARGRGPGMTGALILLNGFLTTQIATLTAAQ